jgi:hypothetical protein
MSEYTRSFVNPWTGVGSRDSSSLHNATYVDYNSRRNWRRRSVNVNEILYQSSIRYRRRDHSLSPPRNRIRSPRPRNILSQRIFPEPNILRLPEIRQDHSLSPSRNILPQRIFHEPNILRLPEPNRSARLPEPNRSARLPEPNRSARLPELREFGIPSPVIEYEPDRLEDVVVSLNEVDYILATEMINIFVACEKPKNCFICEEDYQYYEIKIKACGHTFHPSCISKWLKERSVNCPLCRKDSREGIDF